LISDQLLKFVRDNKDRPFFAYVPFTIPHAAMHVPEDDHAPWREKWPQFDNKIGKYKGPDVKNPIAAFAGMMTRMDRHVGELMALLKELGIDDNTIVSFTSDNGPHMEGGHDPKFFNSNGPLKGHKRDLYEGGIRVPFVARWPGKIKAGTETDIPVAMWDVLPTCLEIAQLESPDRIDGISYLPALLGKTAEQPRHEYLYWAFYERGGKQAVRMGKWKSVRNNVGKNPNSIPELYDLTSDIGETKNVAADHPDIVKQMETYMQDAHTPSADWTFAGRKKKQQKK
jgi:arylsulfatase A-like enzyme